MTDTDNDRLTRIETRLVQLMHYLGASPGGRNTPGGFLDNLKEALDGDTDPDQTHGGDGYDAAPGTRWADLDKPAYQRRSRDGAERVDSAPATQAGKLAR